MILNTIIRDQLLLRHIDRVDLDAVAVLHRPGDSVGKRGHITLALLVFEYLGPILRHHARYLQVDDLPGFIAGFLIAAVRQNASINRQDFDLIRIGNRLERCAGTALLPPRLAAALLPWVFSTVGGHWRGASWCFFLLGQRV